LGLWDNWDGAGRDEVEGADVPPWKYLPFSSQPLPQPESIAHAFISKPTCVNAIRWWYSGRTELAGRLQDLTPELSTRKQMYGFRCGESGGRRMPINDEINKEFGVYRTVRCGAEMVISEGSSFPIVRTVPN